MKRVLLPAVLVVLVVAGCGSAPAPAGAPASPGSTPAAGSEPAETTQSPAGIERGADPEVDAVVTAWTAVFDSAVPVEDKLAHLADPDAARATLEAYAGAGDRVGGISLAPTDITIDGDTATVIYDVLFGGTAAYSGQDGTVTRSTDGAWVVPIDQFCSFMAAARTPCPS